MDRYHIRKVIISFLLLFILFFNRLEVLDPLAGLSFSKEIVDRNHHLLRLALTTDDQYRVFRKLNQIHPDLQAAVLLNEDRYFYYHWGINPISILRAAFSLKQARPYGASTITMQMVRLRDKIYTKSMSGKLWQIVKAIEAEFLYSKKQIFEAYLNLTPYGANIEGVEAASKIYFNKSAHQLSLPEALLLAVIPQNPVKRNLQNTDQAKAIEARDRLYQQWVQKFPEQKTLNINIQIPMLSQKISELPFKAPHFVQYIMTQTPTSEKNYIHTTLDLNLQELLEAKFNRYIQTKSNLGVNNGALLLIQKDKKEIKAWIGSIHFFNSEIQGQIDAITTPRSPGSALKPFLYGLALDEGLIHTHTLLFDSPSSFGIYDPENFDHGYKGPISAEEALIQSRNVPAIFLASRLKKKSLYQLLSETDMNLPHHENYYGLAIALGSAEITPLALGGLYTALANLGRWSPLKYQFDNKPKTLEQEKKILSSEASFMVLDMLKKNIRSESALLDEVSKSKYAIAWKTGTSYGFRDAWVAGVIGDYVLVVWLGNFNNNSNPALVGREIAAPLFFEIADLLKTKEVIKDSDWQNSLGLKVKSTEVCSLTGGFSRGACPHLKKTWFYAGVSPIDDCQVHREFFVSKKTGLRLCRFENGDEAQKETFEFWPSDIVQLFIKNGLPYKKAPSFEKSCESILLGPVAAPEIIFPKADLSYSVRFNQKEGYEKIPFKAKVDQEIKKVFWFANQKPLGESPAGETLFAELSPGPYDIMAVDDRGQVAHRRFQVKVIQ